MKHICLVVALVFCSSVSRDGTISIDFDALVPGLYGGVVPTMLYSDADFDVLMVRFGSSFEIIPTLPGMPASWGAQTLSPFVDAGNVAPFSVLIVAKGTDVVGRISFETGDYLTWTRTYTQSPSASGRRPPPLRPPT